MGRARVTYIRIYIDKVPNRPDQGKPHRIVKHNVKATFADSPLLSSACSNPSLLSSFTTIFVEVEHWVEQSLVV